MTLILSKKSRNWLIWLRYIEYLTLKRDNFTFKVNAFSPTCESFWLFNKCILNIIRVKMTQFMGRFWQVSYIKKPHSSTVQILCLYQPLGCFKCSHYHRKNQKNISNRETYVHKWRKICKEMVGSIHIARVDFISFYLKDILFVQWMLVLFLLLVSVRTHNCINTKKII